MDCAFRYELKPDRMNPLLNTIDVEIVRGNVHAIEQLAPEWDELARHAVNDFPYYHAGWMRSYLTAFEPSAETCLVCIRTGGRLDALLPLVQERGSVKGIPVKKLRLPANVHTVRSDVLMRDTANAAEIINKIWTAFEKQLQWDVFEARDVPDGSVLLSILDHATVKQSRVPGQKSPYFLLPEVCQDECWLADLKPSFRKDLRRTSKQLSELGNVTLTRVETADINALERFYKLEGSGWKGSSGSSIISDVGTKAFYDNLASEGQKSGGLSLYLLELDGRLIAGHFGITHRGRYSSLKWAYDEEFSRYSPGHLIISEICRDLSKRDVREIDLLGNWSEAKAKWARETRQHWFVRAFNSTIAGTLAAQMELRIAPVAKRLIRGRPANPTINS
jgi:CelD/BcsL family acetyltransferase involved in cellulose biosynthesis